LEPLTPRRVSRRLLETAAAVLVVIALVLALPGLGNLRRHLAHAAPGWVAGGMALELLSALCYVVIFRSVFGAGMRWRLSYQIGMAEQAANALLSASGAGGLAVGVWALDRLGMSRERIARRTAAFFLLTSMANVTGVTAIAALYLLGVLGHDPNPALTYSFGAAALIATLLVLALPTVLRHVTLPRRQATRSRRVTSVLRLLRYSVAEGVGDGMMLLRRRPLGVIAGSLGTTAFDLAVLGVCFRAFGGSPPIGVLVLGYLIGQLGGNLPLPGGLGGIDGGLVGTFALFHQPVAQATAAVLVYHAISLWVPALLGTAALLRLRNTLRREQHPVRATRTRAGSLEPVAVRAPLSR
ncbi:MAG: lysylphosphatidylglycerol synthase transmembrane domain-containing protein, partial [Solirubrobacteraceae bacterium]